VREVLDTFRVVAELGSDKLGSYIISMASNVYVIKLEVSFLVELLFFLFWSNVCVLVNVG
jgi:phosphoenolpyruvate carboxylase